MIPSRLRRAGLLVPGLALLLVLAGCRDLPHIPTPTYPSTTSTPRPTTPTSLPPVSTTTSAPSTSAPTTTSSPPSAKPEQRLAVYVTGYSWHDNTPPGSAAVSHPMLHRQAGGTGTYDDPITVAVGHSLSSGFDILDWPAGTRFYLPNLRRYLIVEDTCGDGPQPEQGPCHTGYPAGADTWLDVWVDGRDGSAAQADACMDAITDVWSVIANPVLGYLVEPGPVASGGRCADQHGDEVIVGETPPPSGTPSTTPTSSSTTPPPASSSTPPPTSSDGATAAAARGWGSPVAGDEFDYVGAPDPTRWGVYNGAGHGGNGRRVPEAFSVDGSVLRLHGDERGNSGGMAYRGGQYRGKWEARMRAPAGDGDYHPVLLLWPDAEDWPRGGEIDYAEVSDAGRQGVDFFLHYGADNRQTHAVKRLDVTQWHNYAVEWTASCITGYVDGAQWFSDCNAPHLPPRAMHMTVQLDAFDGTGPYTPSDMFVDWIRQYAA